MLYRMKNVKLVAFCFSNRALFGNKWHLASVWECSCSVHLWFNLMYMFAPLEKSVGCCSSSLSIFTLFRFKVILVLTTCNAGCNISPFSWIFFFLQVPCYSYGQKLSKLAILRIACNYILSLAQLAELDYSSDHSSLSFSQCVEQCTRTLQAEGRSKKRKVRMHALCYAYTEQDMNLHWSFDNHIKNDIYFSFIIKQKYVDTK